MVVDFSTTFSTSFGLSRLTVAISGLSMGTLILGIPSSNEDRTCGHREGLCSLVLAPTGLGEPFWVFSILLIHVLSPWP